MHAGQCPACSQLQAPVAPSVRGWACGISVQGYGAVTGPVSQKGMLRLSSRRSLGQDHVLGHMSLSLYDSDNDKLGPQASA